MKSFNLFYLNQKRLNNFYNKVFELSERIHISTKQILKTCFEEYYKPLVIFATNFNLRKEEGEDLVQELFVHLWKNKPSFDNKNVLKSFLYRAVKNKCLNHLKHQQIKKGYAETVRNQWNDDAYVTELQHKVQLTDYLYKAIEQLSERRQEVVKHSIKGMANKEIAERMDITLNTK